MRVAFDTLGCKLSYAETSTFERDFINAGYEVVNFKDEADVYVINTCSVTEHADKKCRNIIRRIHRHSPNAKIVVTGCYAQLKPQEIFEIEGVHAVLGADYKHLVYESAIKDERTYAIEPIDMAKSFFGAYSVGERTRSFLKVQDGCDYHCSYCTVPLARGDSRNEPISTIVSKAKEIAVRGVKEVVLTGVNTGDFGKSTSESFLDLLKALNAVDGIERYRISSIEPNLLTNEIVDWIASGTKFQPHFHIPLQSGCDTILSKMGRRYTTEFFSNKIAYIREKMGENVFFGIDVIVGFPGESDDDFMTTYNFLKEIRPAFIHIFPYSRRANTIAAAIKPQVQDCIKTKRVKALDELCKELHNEFYLKNRGRTEYVLFESTDKNGEMFGYTGHYIRVNIPYDASLIGVISKVII